MKTFSPKFMRENSGCYTEFELLQCSFMEGDIITAKSILNSEISLQDKYWFFTYKVFDKNENENLFYDLRKLYRSKKPFTLADKTFHEITVYRNLEFVCSEGAKEHFNLWRFQKNMIDFFGGSIMPELFHLLKKYVYSLK